MSERSLIGWLQRMGYIPWTLNVCIGCEPVSDGCTYCYAPRSVIRQQHLDGRDGIVRVDDEGRPIWTGKVLLFPERLDRPRRKRQPHMIFLTALGDPFSSQVPEEFVDAVWQMMRDTPQHIYIVLTKQPKRMRDLTRKMVNRYGILPNVWIGVSTEDQRQAEIRIPFLLETPAAVRIVSAEPLLGPVDLTRLRTRGTIINALSGDVINSTTGEIYATAPGHIDWVIVGGESARKGDARPMHPQWARALRDQTTSSGRAFFFKQHGSWGPAPWVVRVCDPKEGWTGTAEELAEAKARAEAIGATHAYSVMAHLYGHSLYEPPHKPWSVERTELPNDDHAPMRFYTGKSAGCELDGQVWHQWPSGHGTVITAPQQNQEVPA